MSTSPSWFDQEKFSHLVKKVGRKPGTVPAQPAAVVKPAARSPEKETRRLLRSEVKKGTQPLPPTPVEDTPIDTVIRATPKDPNAPENESFGPPPSMPLPEIRSVSPLSRRTTPLPNLKSIFEYEQSSPSQSQPMPGRPALSTPSYEVPSEVEEPADEEEELQDEPVAPEGIAPSWAVPPPEEAPVGEEQAGYDAEELARVTQERDSARRDYANLRSQFEILKQDPSRQRGDAGGSDLGESADSDDLRAQITAREKEISALKIRANSMEDVIDSLRQELGTLQAQLSQPREETSIAQRGLALSQKALQETRDALREASEGSQLMKTNLEHLKNECSTLVQQNMLLQAQHDQLARELAMLKAKPGAR